MINRIICLITACCILSACASSYKPIKPAELDIVSGHSTNGVAYGYRYDVLTNTGNKKYANKETKKGIKLIAVKFENNTDKAIVFRESVQVLSAGKTVYAMESNQIHQQLKQPAPLYLLWGLLWVTINNGEGDVTPIPVGLGIGAINVSIAAGANKKFLAEVKENNLLDKTIQPGETVYGLLGLPVETSDGVEFKVNQ